MIPACACGCGALVKIRDGLPNMYLSGHNYRNQRLGEEHRAKIAAALIGVPKSERHRANISSARKGKTGKALSAVTRDRISVALKGRIVTAETRAKLSASLKGKLGHRIVKPLTAEQSERRRLNIPRGDKSPHWRGGVSLANDRIRNSIEMRAWKIGVFKRASGLCQGCGAKAGRGARALNAHHIKPFATYPELRFDDDNGIALCVACHKLAHAKR